MFRRLLAVVVGLAAAATVIANPGATAQGPDPNVKVVVTIERIRALDCMEGSIFGACLGSPDFYTVVTMGGEEFSNEANAIDDKKDIRPNWGFSREVPLSTEFLGIEVEVRDEDGFLRFGDDHIDVTPDAGRNLNIVVDLAPCEVIGDVSGDCGTTLVTSGTSDERAQLEFRVEVVEPPSAPGLRVSCIHSPIWPQPGDTVTITAQALDGSLNPKPLNDELQIWVGSDTTAPARTDTTSGTTFSVANVAAGEFSYGCRALDDGLSAWTGWRTTTVGATGAVPPPPRVVNGIVIPQPTEPVPVLFTGNRASRLDIVFYADDASYTGPTDPAFIADVQRMIINGYYSEDIFLANQDQWNFWIALDAAQIDRPSGNDPACDQTALEVPFMDAGAIVHTDNLRDCAPGGGRTFSTEPTSLRTLLHETGHRPFGLADEYCNTRPASMGTVCDGGYFQSDPFPNVYAEREDAVSPADPSIVIRVGCDNDAPNYGATAANCEEIFDDGFWFFDKDWYVADPDNTTTARDHLMNDNGPASGADTRRIEWLFGRCDAASC